MPKNYETLDVINTVQVLAANAVDPIVYVTIQTKPTGLRLSVVISEENWGTDKGATILDNIAVFMEGLVTQNHVVASSPTQDLDLNNLLADFVDCVVQYDRPTTGLPPLYGTAHVPMASVYRVTSGINPGPPGPGNEYPEYYIDAEYARLQAIGGP